jgi:uncharacterized tellurite resistance protein B-like protein
MASWFEQLRQIVGRHEPGADPQALPRAAAALMLELGVMEDGGDADELAIVHQAMQQAFGIAAAELGELLEEARTAARRSVSLHEFTRDLRTGLSATQRAELVGWLWRVALADARLGAEEEHLVRRIADLLAVPHGEFIRQKLAAQERAR